MNSFAPDLRSESFACEKDKLGFLTIQGPWRGRCHQNHAGSITLHRGSLCGRFGSVFPKTSCLQPFPKTDGSFQIAHKP
jgi:hypothetical protein